MKEQSPTIPDVVAEKPVLTVQDLQGFTEEQWIQPWQDKQFLRAFPSLVTHLISRDVREQFTEDQRTKLFTDGLSTFVVNGRAPARMMMFSKNGEIAPRLVNARTDEDHFPRAIIGHIMLIAMTLPPNRKMAEFTKLYRGLKPNYRTFLADELGRLLAINNATRAFIKENKLDLDNGFEWDQELITLLLSIYKNRTKGGIIPQEVVMSLEHFSPTTINAVLDYVLENYNTFNKSTRSFTLTDFVTEVEKSLTSSQIDPELRERMQQKLEDFKEKIGYKRSHSPPYSSEFITQITYTKD